MYHEEQLIGGVMCCRTTPDGEFVPYTLEQLSLRYEDLKAEFARRMATSEELI